MAPQEPTGARETNDSPLRGMAGAMSVEAPEDVAARRAGIVAVLEREIVDAPVHRRSARRWRMAIRALGAIAAGGGLVFAVSAYRSSPSADGVRVEDGQAIVLLAEGSPHTSERPSATLRTGEAIRSGETLITGPGSGLHLELGGKTNVELSGSSSLELEKAELRDQEFFLRRGKASFDVGHPTGLGTRLVRVHTPEARVTVRGTRFGVEVLSHPDSHREYTHVWVERGAVNVEANGESVVISPGQDWRSDGAPPRAVLSDRARDEGIHPVAEAPSTARQAVTKATRPAARVGSSHGSGSDDSAVPLSTLREQNESLEGALALARAGKTAESRVRLLAFLERYPNSPLRAAALAELRRQDQNR